MRQAVINTLAYYGNKLRW